MIKGLNHLTMSTIDLEKSFEFYTSILGFKPLMRHPTGAYLLAGDLWFCLDQGFGNTLPSTSYTHFAFSVNAEDFRILSDKIKQSKAIIWKENKSEGDSLYFLDPDGYKLEIHVGDWVSRTESYKKSHRLGFKFYE